MNIIHHQTRGPNGPQNHILVMCSLCNKHIMTATADYERAAIEKLHAQGDTWECDKCDPAGRANRDRRFVSEVNKAAGLKPLPQQPL